MRMPTFLVVLALFSMLYGSPAQAQVADAYCDQTFGTTGRDYSHEVSPACDDGYVIAGTTGWDAVGGGEALLI